MSFWLSCPNCGPRGVYEFRYGGELNPRLAPPKSWEEWTDYLYMKRNVAGVQEEWWLHRNGCGRWFQAQRDTVTNNVLRTYWAEGPGSEPEQQAVQGGSVEP